MVNTFLSEHLKTTEAQRNHALGSLTEKYVKSCV